MKIKCFTVIALLALCVLTCVPCWAQSAYLLTNKGSLAAKYDVVVVDTTNENAFKTTTDAVDSNVLGVLWASTATNVKGPVLLPGSYASVTIDAAVVVGDYLTTSTTAGRAIPAAAGVMSGVFALALEAGAQGEQVACLLVAPNLTGVGTDMSLASLVLATPLAITSGGTGNATGLAATATILATARAINGVDFNGSAAITVPVNNANSTTAADMFVVFTATQGGNYAALTNAGLKFNPSTGLLTATGLSGPLTGNVTGNCSGSSGSCTGTAANASTLLTKTWAAPDAIGSGTPNTISGTTGTFSGAISGLTLESTIATGDPPLIVASTTQVANLNAATAGNATQLGGKTWAAPDPIGSGTPNTGVFSTLGVNTTGPDRKLDVLDASNPQIRLTHTDGTKWVDLQANTNGILKVTSHNTTYCAMNIGIDDTVKGVLALSGHGTGSNSGGVVDLYTAADFDTTINYYELSVYQDDLYIGPSTDVDSLKYDGGTGVWSFTGAGGLAVTGNVAAAGFNGPLGSGTPNTISGTTLTLSGWTTNSGSSHQFYTAMGGVDNYASQAGTTSGSSSNNYRMWRKNDAGTQKLYGGMFVTSPTITANAEVGKMMFGLMGAVTPGTVEYYAMYLDATGLTILKDLTVNGGGITAGVNSTTQGKLVLWDGGGGNTPAYAQIHSPNGTAWYVFVEDDGTLKIHNAAPTQNGDGSVVGAQT